MERSVSSIRLDGPREHRYRPVARCAVPVRAKDPCLPDVDIPAATSLFVPRLIGKSDGFSRSTFAIHNVGTPKGVTLTFDTRRLEPPYQSPPPHRPQPAKLIVRRPLIVISLDRDDRNPGFLHHRQPLDRMVHRLGRHDLLMKKIPAHDDKVDLLTKRISPQHVGPRVKKIARALRQLIPRAPKMD